MRKTVSAFDQEKNAYPLSIPKEQDISLSFIVNVSSFANATFSKCSLP